MGAARSLISTICHFGSNDLSIRSTVSVFGLLRSAKYQLNDPASKVIVLSVPLLHRGNFNE